MNRSISEIIEEIEGLVQAWPDAPDEVWGSLYKEFAVAVARECEDQPRPPERPIRRNHGTAPPRS